ncbi:hypothetical protein QJS04_geneDACA002804 [Acorus gramineus]|uniref:Uncharacterized protein n=1 Tax=Acorus gramineus TaxID=55184 RepID=A0AAV9BUU8_ACOGR|nr:hypothetical protein QJS04_geneDACA002804 [Acorus gramineus]
MLSSTWALTTQNILPKTLTNPNKLNHISHSHHHHHQLKLLSLHGLSQSMRIRSSAPPHKTERWAVVSGSGDNKFAVRAGAVVGMVDGGGGGGGEEDEEVQRRRRTVELGMMFGIWYTFNPYYTVTIKQIIES